MPSGAWWPLCIVSCPATTMTAPCWALKLIRWLSCDLTVISHTCNFMLITIYTAACSERHSQGQGSCSDTAFSQLRVSSGPFVVNLSYVDTYNNDKHFSHSIDFSLITFNWFHTIFVDTMPSDVSCIVLCTDLLYICSLHRGCLSY